MNNLQMNYYLLFIKAVIFIYWSLLWSYNVDHLLIIWFFSFCDVCFLPFLAGYFLGICDPTGCLGKGEIYIHYGSGILLPILSIFCQTISIDCMKLLIYNFFFYLSVVFLKFYFYFFRMWRKWKFPWKSKSFGDTVSSFKNKIHSTFNNQK